MQNNEISIEQAHIEVLSRSLAMGAAPPAILKHSLTPFQKTYFYRPDAFVMDCFFWEGDKKPTSYQIEIIADLPKKMREAVRGPHGLGKTALAAWLVHWFALTRDGLDWKIPTTAGAWRQLTKYLWPEIHKWARQIRWDKIGRGPYTNFELLKENLKLKTGEAFAAAAENYDLIEGAHADYLLYIYDEAKAIPEATFNASEGAFSGGKKTEAYALAISTPGEPLGRFYDIHKRKAGYEDWSVRHVTRMEAVAAGRISQDWADQRRRQWGEQSALYQNRVEGNFFAGEEDSIIPIAWLEEAVERWKDWRDSGFNSFPFTCVGSDIATSGDATTEHAMRYGNGVKEIRTSEASDTMVHSGMIAGIIRARGGYAVIDSLGVGAGVLDRVKEEQLAAFGFVASNKCEALDRSGEFGFANLRTAAWWNLREMLNPIYNENVMLPDDPELIQDLNAPKWRVTSSGKIVLESKGETQDGGKGIIQRLGRSTNKGDAVVMAFCPKSFMKSAQTAMWIAV